jgi:hypothetical protein
MNNILGRFTIPYMALPFNVVAICSFTILKNSNLVSAVHDGMAWEEELLKWIAACL